MLYLFLKQYYSFLFYSKSILNYNSNFCLLANVVTDTLVFTCPCKKKNESTYDAKTIFKMQNIPVYLHNIPKYRSDWSIFTVI